MDSEIQSYKHEIAEHKQEIRNIKAGQGLAEGATTDQKIAMVKAEQDLILACETAIHDLRQQQQQTSASSAGSCCFTVSLSYLSAFLSVFFVASSYPLLCRLLLLCVAGHAGANTPSSSSIVRYLPRLFDDAS
jgi:hypothetical protein